MKLQQFASLLLPATEPTGDAILCLCRLPLDGLVHLVHRLVQLLGGIFASLINLVDTVFCEPGGLSFRPFCLIPCGIGLEENDSLTRRKKRRNAPRSGVRARL
jgi:hypothetical protein